MTTTRQALSWDQEYKPRLDELFLLFADTAEGEGRIDNKEMFMLCLSFGFATGLKRPIPPRKTDAVRLSYLSDLEWTYFRTVAISDSKSSDVLLSDDKVLDIVEQYSAGGLELLVQQLDRDPLGLRKWLLGELYKSALDSKIAKQEKAS